VDAKRVDPEAAAHRPPDEAVRQLDRVELVEVDEVHASSSWKRGSSRRLSRSLSDSRYPRSSGPFGIRSSSANASSKFPANHSRQALFYARSHALGRRSTSAAMIWRHASMSPALCAVYATANVSQPPPSNASPTVAPTTKTMVPSSSAVAVRWTSGGTKMSVP